VDANLEPAHRRSARFSAACLLAALAVAALLVLVALPPAVGATRGWQVSAWTFGDRASLSSAVASNAIDEVQPDWFAVRRDGALLGDTDAGYVTLAHAHGLRVLATVANYREPVGFDRALAHAILTSSSARQRLVDGLLALCVSRGYDGVDVDFENMRAGDRDLFSSFIEQLAAALHSHVLLLGIAVEAKTSEPGEWSSRAQDWSRLGAAVDEFQVMTYAYHGPWSDPGPIAPPRWTDRVVAFAETQVAPGKVWMGVPFYGAEWWPNGGAEIVWREARRRMRAHHVRRLERTRSGEVGFSFLDRRGRRHVVYYQDRVALAVKLDVLRREHPGIAGIAIWVMGGEDPRFWPLIAARLAAP